MGAEIRHRLGFYFTLSVNKRRVSDYFFGRVILPSYGKKASRQTLNPDYKLKRHTEKLQTVSTELRYEFGGVESVSYVSLNSTLGEGSTKLLLLQPGDKRSHNQVTLKEHSLNSCPPYEAVSYTWGNQIYQHIECDGKLLRIRENEWLALQSLRQEARQTKIVDRHYLYIFASIQH